MSYNFAKRLWQSNSVRRSNRRPRGTRLSLEHLEDRLVPAGLTINPIFDSSITSDPNAAKIEGTINTAIQNVQSSFSNPITVNIKFQEGSSGLGSNSTWFSEVSYASLRASLAAAATTPDAQSAVNSLPTSIDNPVNNNAYVYLTDPDARALGYSGAIPPSGPDGIITLNTSICNLDRTSIDPSKYDLQSVAAHEIDEVLGFGSALNGLANGAPTPTGAIQIDDLWRFDQNSNRSFNTNVATQAYFSIDGGKTDLAQFNQSAPQAGPDFSDWASGQTPQVQDALATPGATPNLGVELIRLNVDGYTPALPGMPTGLKATSDSNGAVTLSWNSDPQSANYTVQYSTDGGNSWQTLNPPSGVGFYVTPNMPGGPAHPDACEYRVYGNNGWGSGTPSAGVMTSDEYFVEALYKDLQTQPASQSGLDYWVLQIPQIGQSGVAQAFVYSTGTTGYLDYLVNGMYTNYLGHSADPSGLAYWVGQLQHGTPFEQVLSDFMALGLPTDPTTFVNDLYTDLLHRNGSASEVQGWVKALNNGTSRYTIAYDFLTCNEFRQDAVTAMYDGTANGSAYWFVPNLLNTTPDPNGVSYWLGQWNSHGYDLLQMDLQFASSSAFYNDAQPQSS